MKIPKQKNTGACRCILFRTIERFESYAYSFTKDPLHSDRVNISIINENLRLSPTSIEENHAQAGMDKAVFIA